MESASAAMCPLKGRFCIPADEAKQIFATRGIDSPEKKHEFLMSLVKPASALAHTPISKFNVGAVGLSGSGAIYVGVNIEFPSAHLNYSIHGEQFLVMNCMLHDERSIEMLAVSEAPCGHCRQFCAELSNSNSVQFVYGSGQFAHKSASCSQTASSPASPKQHNYHVYTLDQLLPAKFGPHDIMEDGSASFPLLLDPQANSVKLAGSAASQLEAAQSSARSAEEANALVKAASEAELWAQKAYSPYTHSPSGAAIITHSGQVYGGCWVESVAFNPSMSPFHVAWIHAVTAGTGGFEEIAHVVLAEVPSAPVQHAELISAALRKFAPQAKVTSLTLEWA